ncbi:MAG: hypothetical protein OJF49_000612 [Ktedonobacterales bacterium]|nr:MAG: hypothetical protein OJF49_000612 [Ktedonobacterales bacterium]
MHATIGGGSNESAYAEDTVMRDAADAEPVVFILDCDNTLLDNDALKADLDAQIHALLGDARAEQFWRVYEEVRLATGTVDFPLTLERFRPILGDDPLLECVHAIIFDYPFASRLYPDTLATLRHLQTIGSPVIVSDGDIVYQPLKIARSGLAAAVDEQVAIYIHKEAHLDEIVARWSAPIYVMVDDKARILSATKARMPQRFVTVHIRQGHYGLDPHAYTPAPDLSLDAIGDLRHLSRDDLRRYLG